MTKGRSRAKIALCATLLLAAEAGAAAGAWWALAGVADGRVRVAGARRPADDELACRAAALGARYQAESAWGLRADAERYRELAERNGLEAAALLGRSAGGGGDAKEAALAGGVAGFWSGMAERQRGWADEAQARSMTEILRVLERCR